MWPDLSFSTLRKLYRRFKRRGYDPTWHASSETLQRELYRVWLRSRDRVPIEVLLAECRQGQERDRKEGRSPVRSCTTSMLGDKEIKMHFVKAERFRDTEWDGKPYPQVLMDDILDPERSESDPNSQPCGNIWGVARSAKQKFMDAELRRRPDAICAWIECEGRMVAFLLYDEDPFDTDRIKVGIDDGDVYDVMSLHLEELERLCMGALGERYSKTKQPVVYHELVFMCSHRHRRRYGTTLLDGVLEHMSRKHRTPFILLAEQAFHVKVVGRKHVRDEKKTQEVAKAFYAPHWSQVRVSYDNNREQLYNDPSRGHPLQFDYESQGISLPLWIRRVRPARATSGKA